MLRAQKLNYSFKKWLNNLFNRLYMQWPNQEILLIEYRLRQAYLIYLENNKKNNHLYSISLKYFHLQSIACQHYILRPTKTKKVNTSYQLMTLLTNFYSTSGQI
jgi:hypothetical protein